MTTVERRAEDFVIDASLLTAASGLSQDEIRAQMRTGAITSRCEAGLGKDAGRWRLTFYHGERACRLIVDGTGKVLTQDNFPTRITRPKPAAGQEETGPLMGHGSGSSGLSR